ncbi:hypothetical protein PPTG_22935 [Phytophthora nicotianae INRA-310]|uniref:Uncharacterized protein n=1 Tax=Phytophthora nicotianae (strain INRA-310) TaxID=761204 RepID=W2Q8P9_PHYN3|nr:hypothetical protein PPTG_22935 [Phytophthora nicotianae INRA-310]ETN09241.1 hypothetical protein PPTG_22935 [Phytophthora nicotianae INRA-310]
MSVRRYRARRPASPRVGSQTITVYPKPAEFSNATKLLKVSLKPRHYRSRKVVSQEATTRPLIPTPRSSSCAATVQVNTTSKAKVAERVHHQEHSVRGKDTHLEGTKDQPRICRCKQAKMYHQYT